MTMTMMKMIMVMTTAMTMMTMMTMMMAMMMMMMMTMMMTMPTMTNVQVMAEAFLRAPGAVAMEEVLLEAARPTGRQVGQLAVPSAESRSTLPDH
eukprot:140743-Prorocentrum_minimum.AAC.1